MKIVILDALTFGETSLKSFDQFGEVVIYETTSPEELFYRIADADVIVTNKVVIGETDMGNAPSLKLICVAATGMNNIDLNAAAEREIVVKNVAGYSTDSVIQLTFSMLFYLMNHAHYYDEYVKEGKWHASGLFTHVGAPFYELKGKKWGIIGLGKIGEGVAKIATAFGAEVSYYSTSGKNTNEDYRRIELKELLIHSDIISIHAPLNDATNNLLNYSNLSRLRKGTILLNLGRGGIIDEKALARAMNKKEIYAGLDVLTAEPISDPHPLMEIDHPERLYITPHIAWTSVEARDRLIEGIIENIHGFIKEQKAIFTMTPIAMK
ncbi:MAG: D-2-hydroxyacid dehydrogenase [Epsilonproteobacteria bacterium]|nr:MAG: D-2-hydroxyacid dehydrogenase [Campylobacterota bacterium]